MAGNRATFLVNVRSGHDVVSFTWNTSGTKFITLTAQSAHGTGKYTHMIEIPTGTLPAPEYRLHGLNFGPFVVDGEDPSQDAQIPEEITFTHCRYSSLYGMDTYLQLW